MAGMEDYFGPRRKVPFENYDIYDIRNDDSRYVRGNSRWDDRVEGNLIRRPSALLPDHSDVRSPTAPPIFTQNRSLENDDEGSILYLTYIGLNRILLMFHSVCHILEVKVNLRL